MSALDEFLSELRGILSQWPPGPEHWEALCEAFDRDLSEECLKGGLEYAVRVVDALWPDELCVAPEHWRAAALQGQQHPAWALVRVYDVYLSYTEDLGHDAVQTLRTNPRYGADVPLVSAEPLMLWSCCGLSDGQKLKAKLEDSGVGVVMGPFGAPGPRKPLPKEKRRRFFGESESYVGEVFEHANVWLMRGGSSKLESIKAVRASFKDGASLRVCSGLLGSAPVVMLERVPVWEAREIQERLRNAGVLVCLENLDAVSPPRASVYVDGTESLGEVLTKLRTIFFEPPSSESWGFVCELLDVELPADELQVALDYVYGKIDEGWPEEFIYLPSHWREAIKSGGWCPLMPLFKLYDIYVVSFGRKFGPLARFLRSSRGLCIWESRQFLASLPVKIGEAYSVSSVDTVVDYLGRHDGCFSFENGVVLKIVPFGEPFEAEGISLHELER